MESGECSEVKKDDYTIEYRVDSDWENGFYGYISIANISNTALEDWVLEFDFDREITNVWDSVIESHEDNHYVVRNAEYNSTIAPRETVSIGIKGCDGATGDEPINYTLYSYNNITQQVDLDNDDIPDNFEDMSNWNDMEDTDGDSLPDDIEIWLGSNPNETDTDHDKLTDFYEMFIAHTDLLLEDTDNNGIMDGDEDLDCDGLTNVEEGLLSHPLYSDTDSDNINDFDERKNYLTDANLKDSDKDGAQDKWEIENGYNPIVYNDTFNLLKESKGINVTASVVLNASGASVNSLVVVPADDIVLLDNTIPGYIGSPFKFEIDGEFETAEISFEFDESYLEDKNFVPAIYYFIEKEYGIPTGISGNAGLHFPLFSFKIESKVRSVKGIGEENDFKYDITDKHRRIARYYKSRLVHYGFRRHGFGCYL